VLAVLRSAAAFPAPVALAASLRVVTVLVAAYLFLREIWCGRAAALLGALAWAFRGDAALAAGAPEYPAAVALPLILLAARRLAREPGARLATILAIALLAAALSGHAEALMPVSLAGAAYFAFELAGTRAGSRGRVLVAAVSAAAAGLAFAAPARGAGESDPLRSAACAGAVVLPLAFAGLFARHRERWFFAGFGLAAFAARGVLGAAAAGRLGVAAAFSVCVLAALGADRLSSGEGTPAFVAGSAGALALAVWLDGRGGRLLVELAPLALGAPVVVALPRRLRARTAVAGLTVLLAAARVLEQARLR